MTGGIQAVAPSRKVSLFTTAGVVLPIERRRVSIKPFQYAPTASIDPGSSHPTGRQHLRWFEHRLPRLLLFVERLTVFLQGCYPSNKRGQVKQKPRMGRQMAVCSALVLGIGLIYHTWLVKVFLEPGENLSNLFRPAQVCHCVGDGVVVSELQQGRQLLLI